MAINPLSSVELTQTPETSAAFVPVDIKAVSQSSPLTSAKGRVVVLAGSLDNNGAYTAGPISVALTGTSALPTGAATSANQVGTGTAAQTVQGNVAAGATDAGNPVLIAGHYTSGAQPTYTNGQRGFFNIDARGNGRVMPVFTLTTGSDGFSNANLGLSGRDAADATTVMPQVAPYILNPSGAWDRIKKGGVLSRIASTATGGSPTVAKASAGDAQQFWGQNGAAITYLQFYNVATTPVVGTTTIVATYPIAATAQFNQTIPNSLYFSAGVAFAFTTDAAGTTAAAAAAVTSFALFGA